MLSTAQSYPSLTNQVSTASTNLVSNQSITNSAPSTQPTTTTSSALNSNRATNVTQLHHSASLNQHDLTMSLTSTSSESEQDFLDTCQASTLLADLEDEELPEPEDENVDNENEDADYEELMEGEGFEIRNKRRCWDDEYALKRQFSALIPTFDPRPGRTNINQITDLKIPTPGTSTSNGETVKEANHSTKVLLSIRGPNLNGIEELEIDLVNPNWTVFSAIQTLNQASNYGTRQEKLRRVWEPTYVICYREMMDLEVNENLKIYSAPIRVTSSNNYHRESCLSSPIKVNTNNSLGCPVEDVLQLLNLLYLLSKDSKSDNLTDILASHNSSFSLSPDEFISKKLTNKLIVQIQDPLVLASGSQPKWCEHLVYSYPMLFPFDIRKLYFNYTGFGTSRSIVCLQNQRESTLDRARGPSSRREDSHEFRVGRLRHERVKVPRNDDILSWAIEVMKIHASHKSILEVEFRDEEGTGLGPTLEFYALVAAELQRKNLGMWLCDDELIDNINSLTETSEGLKPPGFYIHSSRGLFPSPYPQNHPSTQKVASYFHFLGIFLAKALQDNRLVDLPLSGPFLKLLCSANEESQQTEDEEEENYNFGNSNMYKQFSGPLSEDDLLLMEREEISKQIQIKRKKKEKESKSWFYGKLMEKDFCAINPHQANFLMQLSELIQIKQKILSNSSLSVEDRQNQIRNLSIPMNQAQTPMRLDDLGLTFQYLPPSKIYGFSAVNLKPNGEHEEVTIDNVEEYFELMIDFCLHSGIRKQMEAFKGELNLHLAK